MKLFKKQKWNTEIAPDEIFLDSKNLPAFNREQMEGRLEKPISKRTLFFTGAVFILIASIFIGKAGILQIAKGEAYNDLAERNSLQKELIFADRGIIYDRNNVPLAWNSPRSDMLFAHRDYIDESGFGHILGYVSYPAKDEAGNFWQTEFIGKDGTEKLYNQRLSGENGLKIFETNAFFEIQSENITVPPKHGENVTLSIDSHVQSKLYEALRSFAETYRFSGAAAGIMDVQSGELIALTNYPEYGSEIISSGEDREKITAYVNDSKKPFLNRAVQGLYAPGSILKPIVALAALEERVIDPLKKILSIGYIAIQNPYFPDKKTIFNDWKAHGLIDMREALAQSSDVYFYEIGGGFEDQKGLGISNIEKYMKLFGVDGETGIDLPGENSGVIPTPTWKQKHFDGDAWRIGDTYNTAIGQYGFQVTPVEMLRAVAAIANRGHLVRPHILKDTAEDLDNIGPININILSEYFSVVHEGMRLAVTSGTASRLNLPFVQVAAKTGTAQTGVAKSRVNSWVIGFWPFNEPRYSFVILAEDGPATNTVSSSLIMNQLFSWMNENTPLYLKSD